MLACVRRLVAALLCGTALPRHVALIMDGNRRFADTFQLQRIDGHRLGYAQMKRVIQWCLELGVSCVSVYAFSIDNFRRPPDEVDALMQLAAAKFEELLHDADAKAWRAELRVIGDLSLAPPSIQAAAARLTRGSREHGPTRAVVNICFPYTSSQELQHAMGQVCSGLSDSDLLPHDVTPGLLQRVMHTQDCPPVDLLIRTSGEQRLSDFLLWQSSHALLHWQPCLWPEFGYAQLLRALLAWQAAAPALAQLRAAAGRALREDGDWQQHELLRAGSCGGSGAATPPAVLSAASTAAVAGWAAQHAPGPGAPGQPQQGQQQPQPQQQDARVLDQLRRSSEVLAALQKQQQLQLWGSWGGLFSAPPAQAGGSGPAAAPAGRSPERASSASLSVISEDEATCVPHPSQQLRVHNWLCRLGEAALAREASLAAAGGAAVAS